MSERATTKGDITAARKKKQREMRRKRAARLALAAAVIVAVVALLICLPATATRDISDFFNVMFSNGEFPVSVANSPPDRVQKLDSGFFVKSGNTIKVVSSAGAILQTIETGYFSTGCEADGNKLLTYAVNGNEAALYNRTGKIYNYKVQQNIVAAALGFGKVALVTASERYAGELKVYAANSNELFTWYCAEGYPFMAAFNSSGNRICVGAMYIENGLFKTRLTLLDVAKAEALYTCTVDSTLLRLVVKGSEVIAITETGASLFNSSGELKMYSDFSGKTVTDITVSDSGNIAVSLGYEGHAALSRCIVYNDSLEVLCDLEPGVVIKDVCLARDRLYILSDGEVVCYSFKNQLIETIDCNLSTMAIVMPRSGTVIAIMNATAVKLK